MLTPLQRIDIGWQQNRVALQGGGQALLTLGLCSYLESARIEASCDNLCNVLVGRFCSLAHDLVFLMDLNHDCHCVTTYPMWSLDDLEPQTSPLYSVHRQIIIGNDVWVGRGSTIMGGVRIGNGAVVAANATVTHDVPPYAIVAGNPARVVKYRFDAGTIAKLQRIRWWEWSRETIKERWSQFTAPVAFAGEFDDTGSMMDPPPRLLMYKERGYQLLYHVADFGNTADRVWHSVVSRYLERYTAADKIALVLEVPERAPEFVELYELIAAHIGNAPALELSTTPPFNRAIANLADVYITTKEHVCSQVIDQLNPAARIIYGLDDWGV